MKTQAKWRFQRLAVADIEPDPGNPRRIVLIGPPHDRLLRTVARDGVRVPLQVVETEQGKYRVADGHVRLAACKEAGVEEVPAMVYREPPSDGELRADRILLNEARGPWNPFEQAEAYQQLVDACGGSQASACRLAGGLSRKRVNKILRLQSIEPALRESIQAHNSAAQVSHAPRVTRAQLYEIALADSPAGQKRLARLAMEGTSAKRLAAERAHERASPTDGENHSGEADQADRSSPADPADQASSAGTGRASATGAVQPDDGRHEFVFGDYDHMKPIDIAWPPPDAEPEQCGRVAARLVGEVEGGAMETWKKRGIRLNWSGRKSKDGPIRFFHDGRNLMIELPGPRAVACRQAMLIAACACWDWAGQKEV